MVAVTTVHLANSTALWCRAFIAADIAYAAFAPESHLSISAMKAITSMQLACRVGALGIELASALERMAQDRLSKCMTICQ